VFNLSSPFPSSTYLGTAAPAAGALVGDDGLAAAGVCDTIRLVYESRNDGRHEKRGSSPLDSAPDSDVASDSFLGDPLAAACPLAAGEAVVAAPAAAGATFLSTKARAGILNSIFSSSSPEAVFSAFCGAQYNRQHR